MTGKVCLYLELCAHGRLFQTDMDTSKIATAVARLERNLPIRRNQTRLAEPLRQLHRDILHFFLERGRAPVAGEIADSVAWNDAIRLLAAQHIVVLDDTGGIRGAYPFSSEPREFRVITEYGPVPAMCAFDALAVSSMFCLPVRIEARCRLSGRDIVIEQEQADIRVREPDAEVFAAIGWGAAAGAASCSTTLCTQMMFLSGSKQAHGWLTEDPENRELFSLGEAHALIGAIFVPLMH